MKRILITGANSYIGTNVEQYLARYNSAQGYEYYRVDTISQLNEEWKKYDFTLYDVVFDVTGIAHADITKVTEEQKALYYRVNCDLAVETARKAKTQGVKQFIYMSSIIVYGDSAPVGQKKHITAETKPSPANFYGKSKLRAEQQLLPLAGEGFEVAILRPPFIYGKGCKGNYSQMSKMAKKFPIFPTVKNERSMLYIENLCEFVRLLIECGEGGVFFPQNKEYSRTSEMIQIIAEVCGKKLWGWSVLNPFVALVAKCPGKIGKLANKAFGNLTYDMSMSRVLGKYQVYGLKESIERTEKGNEC